jgi:hypothetical protein
VRCLVLQHIACEPPGAYEEVLDERRVELDRVELDEGDRLPDWRGYDAIIAMGGPMSANDDAELPWLTEWARVPAYAESLARIHGVGALARLLEEFARHRDEMLSRARTLFESWLTLAAERDSPAIATTWSAPRAIPQSPWISFPGRDGQGRARGSG